MTQSSTGGAEMVALEEALSVVKDWTPASDVFALKHHMVATGILSSSSAAFINAHYRKVVKLRNQAFFTTLLPVVITPAIVGSLLHHQFVVRPLVLQQYKCAVCMEVRGGAMQLFSGMIYPMMIAPLAAFQFAVRLYTYPLPNITQPMLWFKELIKLTKPIVPRLYILAGIQIIAGMGWTHWEAQNLFTVVSKVSLMEEEIKRRQQDTDTPHV